MRLLIAGAVIALVSAAVGGVAGRATAHESSRGTCTHHYGSGPDLIACTSSRQPTGFGTCQIIGQQDAIYYWRCKRG
jgi:hypothetical protein